MDDSQPINALEKYDEDSSSSPSASEPIPRLASSPDAEDNETRKDQNTDNDEDNNGPLPSPTSDTKPPKVCDHRSYNQTFASSGYLFEEIERAYSLSDLDPLRPPSKK